MQRHSGQEVCQNVPAEESESSNDWTTAVQSETEPAGYFSNFSRVTPKQRVCSRPILLLQPAIRLTCLSSLARKPWML
jgi:hypothetical protein